ncbi:ABC transporter permease [Paenibacillus camelliae]|uniref:ABC transporter permease n=1 Tax=Paenibacillus camelliae TaxID=512410 RepID=UPI00203FB31C|nr:iron export ABC transporter permease subunit FetB [Paenibacillus camelliae]MCM3632644.1 iron export ABC transporter permease subunit FetB [Paenibacillus camelliae]
MSYLALSFTLIFIAVTMFISLRRKLGLEKDIIIGTVRATIQLLAIGYILGYVFAQHKLWMLIGIIMVMITTASINAAKRGKIFKPAVWKLMLCIGSVEAFVMLMLLGLGMIEPSAQYIIPLSGMTIGNAMVVAGLFLTQLKREGEASKEEIEMFLALGATQKQSLHRLMQRAVRFSMIPTIDALKTVGLVQLPGMMTGMIIAGASPTEAVKYQLLILFVLTGAAALTSILMSILFQNALLTEDLRIRSLK